MKVICDPDKALSNASKHKVHFSDAGSVLYDPQALTIEDKDAEDEQHHASIGVDAIRRILVVVYTYSGDTIRMIPARRATKIERRAYEERI